ncbi:hypothetical protein JI723_05795 [Providencia manganoxydans]|uniref:Uncharacterized protein n=1 Tax=Providencia manganoxydans TaxID=2923283 RepID=A0ABX7AI33_9GAMM|nr:hypothetical protein JI723_05795 [Providencia manganoxydans]
MLNTTPNKLNLDNFKELEQTLSNNLKTAKSVQCTKEQSNGIAEAGSSRFTDNIQSTKNVSDTAPSRLQRFFTAVKKTFAPLINLIIKVDSDQKAKTADHTTELATANFFSRYVDNTSPKLSPSSVSSPSNDIECIDSDYDWLWQYQSRPLATPFESLSKVTETQTKNLGEKQDDNVIYSEHNKEMKKTAVSDYSNKISTSKGDWGVNADKEDTPPSIQEKMAESYQIPREYMQGAYIDKSSGIEEPIFGYLKQGKSN